ncbi:MAG: chemotaxis protein CheB [Bacteroidetes bacterium]|nr:chemotaxis protein CheB [Bacteroidota bacterium]
MDPVLQRKLLGMFYYSINPEGIMLLGSSETLGTQSHLFTPVDSKLKIYKRSLTNLLPELFDFPSSFTRTKPVNIENPVPGKSVLNIQALADQLLLKHFSPAGVLVNENGDIIYISGRTGKYLEPAVGKANLNIFAMLREGLREEFPVAFRKAIMKKEAVVLRDIKVGTNGDTHTINVNIQWIEKPEPLFGTVMIIFSDVPEIANIKLQVRKGKRTLKGIRQSELEKELQYTREEMQSTFEEMQTSQEELKSANEELQSTNEELQSTNEELTTSKEEMQSLNEELQTVNAELQSKVLRTLVFIQKQIPAKDGRWFFIRIMPYRTLDDRIEGLVITFINISDLKKVEVKLHETEQMNRFLINSSSNVIIELSTDLKIVEFSPEAEKFFGKKHEHAVNQNYIQLFVPEQARKKTEKDLNNLLNGLPGGIFKMQVIATGGNMPEVEWSANVLQNNLNMATGIILTLKK